MRWRLSLQELQWVKLRGGWCHMNSRETE